MEIINEYVTINGARQNLMTICTDENNPVLLIVHGGAGMPDRPLVQQYNTPLAERFTVVCWDQRGSGFSTVRGKLTVELLLCDLLAVVNHLRTQYGQDKLYLAGHSWGAWLGLRFVAAYPDCVRYYIGTGQFIASQKDEIVRWNFVRDCAKRKGAARTLRKLDSFGAPKGCHYPHRDAAAKSYVLLQVFLNHGYFSPDSGPAAKILLRYLRLYFRCYKAHVPAVLMGICKALDQLNEPMYEADKISAVTELSVPVLLISGEGDMVCPVSVARAWFDALTAPKKDFAVVPHAAHMAPFEQPEEWNRLVLGLLEETETTKS
jgi:pimeloyl-ACP methyl ester carboxylesterase